MRDQLDLPARPVLFLDDLSNASRTWAKVAAWLTAGVSSPRHPFHWPSVATVGADGFPESRVVVLRQFDPAEREVVFHTDERSPKVADLRRDPRCGFLLYDPDQRVQVRLRTTVALHHADESARREFDALPPHTRASYAALTPPGAEMPPDAPFDYPPRPPVDEVMAFENFVAVVCLIRDVDVLELHEHGHRRAKLWWDDEVRMKRVAP
jgi:hypothetical protein